MRLFTAALMLIPTLSHAQQDSLSEADKAANLLAYGVMCRDYFDDQEAFDLSVRYYETVAKGVHKDEQINGIIKHFTDSKADEEIDPMTSTMVLSVCSSIKENYPLEP